MHLILFFCVLAFSVLVLIAGLFMKSYAAKEGLGRLSKIAASTAIFLGIFIFIASLVMHIMMIAWHKDKSWCEGNMCSGHNKYEKHDMEYKKDKCSCDHKGGKEKCGCDHCDM